MKKMVLIFILSLCCVASVFADSTDKVNAAVQSAESWLQLVDGQKYAESWDEAATIFQQAVSRADWIAQLGPARAVYAEIVDRKVLNATYTAFLPDAPVGEYVVIQFLTKLSDGKTMIETVTPFFDADQSWRVSGYYMR